MEGEKLPFITAGIITTFVAFVVQIVGFASPYWFKCDESHGGLWLACTVKECVRYHYAVPEEDNEIKAMYGGAVNAVVKDAFNATKQWADDYAGNERSADGLKRAGPLATDVQKGAAAMECLTFILLLVAIVCIVLKLFAMKDKQRLYTIIGVANIIAGVFGLIGVVIYGTMDFPGRKCSLNFSFAFCIIASIGALVGGVLFIIGRNK